MASVVLSLMHMRVPPGRPVGIAVSSACSITSAAALDHQHFPQQQHTLTRAFLAICLPTNLLWLVREKLVGRKTNQRVQVRPATPRLQPTMWPVAQQHHHTATTTSCLQHHHQQVEAKYLSADAAGRGASTCWTNARPQRRGVSLCCALGIQARSSGAVKSESNITAVEGHM